MAYELSKGRFLRQAASTLSVCRNASRSPFLRHSHHALSLFLLKFVVAAAAGAGCTPLLCRKYKESKRADGPTPITSRHAHAEKVCCASTAVLFDASDERNIKSKLPSSKRTHTERVGGLDLPSTPSITMQITRSAHQHIGTFQRISRLVSHPLLALARLSRSWVHAIKSYGVRAHAFLDCRSKAVN